MRPHTHKKGRDTLFAREKQTESYPRSIEQILPLLCIPSKYLKVAVLALFSLLFSRINMASSFSHSSLSMVSSPLILHVAFFWTSSSLLTSFLKCGVMICLSLQIGFRSLIIIVYSTGHWLIALHVPYSWNNVSRMVPADTLAVWETMVNRDAFKERRESFPSLAHGTQCCYLLKAQKEYFLGLADWGDYSNCHPPPKKE